MGSTRTAVDCKKREVNRIKVFPPCMSLGFGPIHAHSQVTTAPLTQERITSSWPIFYECVYVPDML